ncbi:MAG TPA: glutamine--fructose-6-phosphate transaminase (isomerizing) [Candidatus Saccharimonadia bacterium]|jgi:glucosamine--fructose-6-phosphate aminotransferase (isomerizing)|nr:glutamine--fructose-6-phosphate transaminase (isomerizing) [Candidatus Saccharimonadia bacterium]
MCGIIGYTGKDNALPILVSGLKRMEYRGYDSAGVAVIDGDKAVVVKRPGKIGNLTEALDNTKPTGHIGIGHTRWATHGVPNELNAHPHQSGHIIIIHNGIIENYAPLKEKLLAKGVTFKSETDTEVLAGLISTEREGADSLEGAVLAALLQVEGTFGLVVLDEREPDKLVAARRGSPLLLGIGDDATYIASDATAIIGYTDRVVYLDDDEIAICTPGKYRIIDFDAQFQEHEEHEIKLELKAIEKAGYDHFLLKEIMEQPTTMANTLRGRLDHENGTGHLGGLNLDPKDYQQINRVLIVACGSAYITGLLGKHFLERLTGLPVDVEVASEFRYRDPVVVPGTLGIVISQSGETADTLASLREMKRRGIPTLGLVNVIGSSMSREVDGGVYLHSGPEISVASTKVVISMEMVQLLIGLQIGRARDLSITEGKAIVEALEALPAQVQKVLDQRDQIKAIAKKVAHLNNAMFLGRNTLYPVAMEGAMKLKETSYIHAEAYPAGELKHGPIALVDENLLCVFLHLKNALYDKSQSGLEQIRARHGRLLIIGTEGDEGLKDFAEDVIYIPDSNPYTQPILANIPLQLLAYYVATERGTDVDQPRNLAKSVTVE